MDYYLFVEAIKQEDNVVIQKYVNVLTKILFKYMSVRLGATQEDSEDCIQNVLLSLIEKVRADKITHPDAILSYVFTSARHDYYKLIEKHKASPDENIDQNVDNSPDQLEILVNNERESALQACLDTLKKKQRDFIDYWFKHAHLEAADVAKKFGISVNNAWTKKHRIIKTLQECVQIKINL